MEDPQVLELGAARDRIIVTHDIRTMPDHFSDFAADQPCSGVILIRRRCRSERLLKISC
jgi:hypothetical protein